MFKNACFLSYDSRKSLKTSFLNICNKYENGCNVRIIDVEKNKIPEIRRYLGYIKLLDQASISKSSSPILVCDGIMPFNTNDIERIAEVTSLPDNLDYDVVICSSTPFMTLVIINPNRVEYIRNYLISLLPTKDKEIITIETAIKSKICDGIKHHSL